MNDHEFGSEPYDENAVRLVMAAVIHLAYVDLRKYVLKGYVHPRTLTLQERFGGIPGTRLVADDVTSAVELFTIEGRLEELLAFRSDAVEYASKLRDVVKAKLSRLCSVAEPRFEALRCARRLSASKTPSDGDAVTHRVAGSDGSR